jgi:anti-anti-sigma factor
LPGEPQFRQFIGCGGLAVMVAAADRAVATGDRFRVSRGSPAIDRLLSLTGFEHRFEMTRSVATG